MRRIFVRRTMLRCGVVAFGVLALGSTSAKTTLSSRGGVPALAVQDAQCVSIVPKAWGIYRGGSAQSGLSLEFRRSGNYN
jgi:hypothetical protein